MGYEIVIGLVINQKFEKGDVVPRFSAIHDGYCHTVLSCVGQTPADFEYDEPIGQINYHFWEQLLKQTSGLKELGHYIRTEVKSMIYLDKPEVREIFERINKEVQKMPKSDFRERVKWLSFWADLSLRKYGRDAAIGLF